MMKLTRISTTSNAPEFEYGVLGRESGRCYMIGTHRECVNFIVKSHTPNAESVYTIGQRIKPANYNGRFDEGWRTDWAED